MLLFLRICVLFVSIELFLAAAQQLQCPPDYIGFKCYPTECCPQMYQCVNGVAYPVINTAPGTVCKQGQLSFPSDCTTACGSSATPTDAPSPTTQPSSPSTTAPTQSPTTPTTAPTNPTTQPSTIAPTQSPTTPTTAPAQPVTASGTKIIGYFTNWARYRNSPYKYDVSSINARLYTHLLFAFATVTSSYTLAALDGNDEAGGMYAQFNTLARQQNPKIKTCYSVGGWSFNADGGTNSIFTNMASSAANRAKFIQSAIQFARLHGFDGIDIDWEYPGDPAQGGRPQDKANFALLLKELRQAVQAETVPAGKSRLLLTIAVGVATSTVDQGYQVNEIHKYLDWIGLMTYDMHGGWEPVTGAHTALYGPGSVDSAVKYWKQQGAPANKLVVGVGSYGRSWSLSNPSQHGMGAPANGYGAQGQYTQSSGFLAYFEVQQLISSGGGSSYDSSTRTMYAWNGATWVGYDDPRTIAMKGQYVHDNALAGTMMWALDLDDFTQGYPLSTALYNQLRPSLQSFESQGNSTTDSDQGISIHQKEGLLYRMFHFVRTFVARDTEQL